MSKRIEAQEVRLRMNHPEWGLVFDFRCPDCGLELDIAEQGLEPVRCPCGYLWDLEIRICGQRRAPIQMGARVR